MTQSSLDLDRRGFLKAGVAGTLATAVGGRTLVQRQGDDDDGTVDPGAADELVKTVCTHCSVGCGLQIAVEDDSVVGQETWDDNPVNQGGLCSKGASLTQTENSAQRLKEPMKMEDGEWVRMDWDEFWTRSPVDSRTSARRRGHTPRSGVDRRVTATRQPT